MRGQIRTDGARNVDAEPAGSVEAEGPHVGNHAFGRDETGFQVDHSDLVLTKFLREAGSNAVEAGLRERIAETPPSLSDLLRRLTVACPRGDVDDHAAAPPAHDWRHQLDEQERRENVALEVGVEQPDRRVEKPIHIPRTDEPGVVTDHSKPA